MRSTFMGWDDAQHAFSCNGAAADAAFVLYFGPNAVIASDAFQAALRASCPNADLIGCTTGTLIAGEDLLDERAMAVAVELENSKVRLASRDISRETSFETGVALAQEVAGPSLAGILVLSDSLNVDGVELVAGLRSSLPAGVPISGGLASDGSDFKHTIVGANSTPREKRAAVLAFYGERVIFAQGCAHGWDIFGPPRRITKAEGPELFELDNEPALDLYERYLGEDAAELPSSALRFPLLVTNPANPSEQVVRTVLGIDRDKKSLIFASAIPQGWGARLMRGAFDHLTDGARAAAVQAANDAHPEQAGLAVLVSCVGRRIVMGVETNDEIEAVAESLGAHFATIGFYSHGEISTVSDAGFCGLHNQTMTVLTIQEAA